MDGTVVFCYNTVMLRIEIDIPRPFETVCLLLAAGGILLWATGESPQGERARAEVIPSSSSAEAGGGADRQARLLQLKSAEEEARRIRTEQAVLSRREEILRYELSILEGAAVRSGDSTSVSAAKEKLLALLSDERAAEERLRETLREMWEAEGLTATVAVGSAGDVRVLWPVEPEEGISALFHDAAYAKRFGIPHNAIDIPVAQGSAIRSTADGVVDSIVDNGLGYSYIIVKHDGFATLYGHASAFFVREGDAVRQGDVLAASGGMPGTKGAGALTTGPHLHFEVIVEGKHIDPLTLLPSRPGVPASAQ